MDKKPLLPDSMLSYYRIISLLSVGGMGEVYQAEDVRLGRHVAVKILNDDFTKSPDRVRRFEQEACAVSALKHENILQIYDIGQENGTHFIVTEFIEGRTLRAAMEEKRLSLREALDIAIQMAGALAAVHAVHIAHRDIKPENVMVQPEGKVKVLDFGLAKVIERKMAATDSGATTVVNTDPGTVMGTPRYMSPEQARGMSADERTDTFSLGIVLYEMVAGRRPFDGRTNEEVVAAILDKEPAPLATLAPDAPPELQHIVNRALRKEREERYQTIKDFLLELQDVKEGMGLSPHAASARRVYYYISRHWRAALIALLTAVTVALAFLYFSRPAPISNEENIVLLTDFENKTSEPVFDTLSTTLKDQIQPLLGQNLFSNKEKRIVMIKAGYNPDEPMTPLRGRQICRYNNGIRAMITGRLEALENSYQVTLEAINARTDKPFFTIVEPAAGKEQVRPALSKAVSRMLGDLKQALKAATGEEAADNLLLEAQEFTDKGAFGEAIEKLEKLVNEYPNSKYDAYAQTRFATCYYNNKRPLKAEEAATRAYQLLEQPGLKNEIAELEQTRIMYMYHTMVTGNVEEAIKMQKHFKDLDPSSDRGPGNLSNSYLITGDFEKAVIESRAAKEIYSKRSAWYANLGEALIHLDRYAEAKAVLEEAVQRPGLVAPNLHTFLYWIAFKNNDAQGMVEQVNWTEVKKEKYVALDWQAAAWAFQGHWQKSQELSQQAIALAKDSDKEDLAARYAAEQALRAAVLGQFQQAKDAARQSLELQKNRTTVPRVALALALCGEANEARTLIGEMAAKSPSDSLIAYFWVPVIDLALKLQTGDLERELEQQQQNHLPRYEPAGEFWPQYLRGLAYLKLRKPAKAAAEFDNILNHRGQGPMSTLFPLAQLGQARVAAQKGDSARARKMYESFFALWIDSDLPTAREAKRDYDRLK